MTSKLVQRKKDLFLDRFREFASISRAAKAAKVERNEHYRWLKSDPKYAAAFDEAQDVAAQALEDEAIRRGKDGVDEPVYQGGQKVGTIRRYSDTLLIFLLKGMRPAKYRDKFIEVPAKAGDGKTPGDIVWVAGSDESSTAKPDQARVN